MCTHLHASHWLTTGYSVAVFYPTSHNDVNYHCINYVLSKLVTFAGYVDMVVALTYTMRFPNPTLISTALFTRTLPRTTVAN